MQVKITSWNIWHGEHLPEIITFLKHAQPDFIGFQEVVEEIIDEKKVNTAETIASELGYNYIYYKAFTSDRHERVYDQGNALLSKYPIKESKCHLLSDYDSYEDTAETEPRIVIESSFLINGYNIKIFVTHLAYSHKFRQSKMRDTQISNLLKVIPKKNSLLLGDFNSEANSQEINRIKAVLCNADTITPDKPTWTVYPFNYHGFVENDLNHRLDNIFVTDDIKVQDFIIEESKGSDHLPVTAIVEL